LSVPDSNIENLLDSKTVAIIGLSDDPEKDSYEVGEYLKGAGYRVVPVNPTIASFLGEKAYDSLADVPFDVDVVDVFRKSEALPGIVDEALAKGAKGVWAQLGIANEEAGDKARAAGLGIVMDRCMMATHRLRENYRKAGVTPPWLAGADAGLGASPSEAGPGAAEGDA
jgi:predicted CoA-binding protein